MAHYPTAKCSGVGGVYAHSAAHYDLNFVKVLFLLIARSQRILSFSILKAEYFEVGGDVVQPTSKNMMLGNGDKVV